MNKLCDSQTFLEQSQSSAPYRSFTVVSAMRTELCQRHECFTVTLRMRTISWNTRFIIPALDCWRVHFGTGRHPSDNFIRRSLYHLNVKIQNLLHELFCADA